MYQNSQRLPLEHLARKNRKKIYITKGRYVLNWGGGGTSVGRVLSNFFINWGGSNLFYSQLGEGNSFFLARKKLLHVASILNIQAKLPVEINLNYFTGPKNLLIKKLPSPN